MLKQLVSAAQKGGTASLYEYESVISKSSSCHKLLTYFFFFYFQDGLILRLQFEKKEEIIGEWVVNLETPSLCNLENAVNNLNIQ